MMSETSNKVLLDMSFMQKTKTSLKCNEDGSITIMILSEDEEVHEEFEVISVNDVRHKIIVELSRLTIKKSNVNKESYDYFNSLNHDLEEREQKSYVLKVFDDSNIDMINLYYFRM